MANVLYGHKNKAFFETFERCASYITLEDKNHSKSETKHIVIDIPYSILKKD